MLSIIECASLAWHIYKPKIQSIHGIEIRDLKDDNISNNSGLLTNINWYRLIDVDPHMQAHRNFYAQLYVKFVNGRAVDAVMVIRGTVIHKGDNDLVDVVSFASDVLDDGCQDVVPVYLSEAINFYNKCERYIAKFFPHISRVKLTGHSLGGVITKLMVLQAGYGVPAIAFNSPGCGHIPGVKKDHGAWVYNVNSRYDVISKIGLKLGNCYVVDVPNLENEACSYFDSFNVKAYEQSVIEYFKASHETHSSAQIVHVMKALGYRYYAYLAALDRLHGSESYIQKAAMEVSHFAVNPQSAVLEKAIHLAQFSVVLLAQHSIDNMVSALYLPENQKVARISI